MAKLKDIAEYLHVSVSTVSRVVNNQDRVDPATRQRTLEALKKFNYQPDDNARRLKTNISNVLGVIVPDISNPFYAMVIKGIERVAAEKGYSVILCNTDENREREKDAIHLLMRQKVAGMIVATIFKKDSVDKYYSNLSCPVVFFDNVPEANTQINMVTINNVRATRDLVRFMLENGHRRIYMITGPAGESSADERLMGWRRSLQNAGIEPEEDWVMHGDFREESGAQIMTEFLNRPKRPTAVCIANNFMAYGAVKSIYAAGLSIPEDISLGAFDIIDATGLMKLNITTILEPAEDIGKIAADICLSANTHEGIKMCSKIILEHAFQKSGSVQKIKA
ncbi:MAG: LacI family DNA-binding transcriptional regulator [Clostridiaceae bacterium]|nr:LacI family DNA-binding transcriptional regulator [Clostridiaceae bacterium]